MCVAAVALAGCSEEVPPPNMPDVTGLTLDVALSDIERAGYEGEPEILGGGLFGVLEEANWVVCEQLPAPGEPLDVTPRLNVDRECGGEEASPEPESEPTDESTSEAAAYVYEGPEYDVVTVDAGAGMSVLDQYWVLADSLDTSAEDYKDQVKSIVADVAHSAGTEDVIVQVVTDEEIIEAESAATIAEFMDSHDQDYWNEVMTPKEKAHWVASYTGGIDYDESELSDADVAYGIDWWPAGEYEREQWKPQVPR